GPRLARPVHHRETRVAVERPACGGVGEAIDGLLRHEDHGDRSALAAGLGADAGTADAVERRRAPSIVMLGENDTAAALSAHDKGSLAVMRDDENASRLLEHGRERGILLHLSHETHRIAHAVLSGARAVAVGAR